MSDKIPPAGFPFHIHCGNVVTMNIIALHGARGLNVKNNRWQVIDKSAKYKIVLDGTDGGADLFCDIDLRKIAREKGLI